MNNKRIREPLLGVVAVVLFAGAAWIAHPSFVALLESPNMRSFLAAAGATGTATLSWNANTESDLASYKVYYGTSPRTGSSPKTCGMCGYTSSINVGKVTTYAFSGLTNGQTYYFSISAIDTSNNESGFSSEVSKAIQVAAQPGAATCTSFTYSDWGTCQSNSTQTRTIATQSPSGCGGGLPLLSQSCTYTASSNVTVTTQASTASASLLQPGNLSAAVSDSSHVTLSWSPPATDFVGYYLYRDGYQIVNTTRASYVDTISSGAHVYTVSAYDMHGSVSTPSSSVTVTLANPSSSNSNVSTSGTSPSGLTTDQINAILSLLASFGADNATINNVRQVLTGSGTVTKNTSSASSSTSGSSSGLTYNLTLYQSDPEVKTLQQFLNTHGFVIASTGSGSPGKETVDFGTKTYNALVKFQKSVGLPATGWLGPMTIKAINSRLSQKP